MLQALSDELGVAHAYDVLWLGSMGLSVVAAPCLCLALGAEKGAPVVGA